jgi:hypothetical protein
MLQTNTVSRVSKNVTMLTHRHFLKNKILAVLTDSQFGIVSFYILNLIVVLLANYVFRLKELDWVEIP